MTPKVGEQTVNKLNEILEIRYQNDIDLHVKEVEEGCTRMELENIGYNLASFDHFKIEICAEFKRVNYEALEGIVHRMQLAYDENVVILDILYVAGSKIGYNLPPGVYEISNLKLTMKSLLLNEVKVNKTIDDIRLRSNLTTNKTISFTEKSSFFPKLGFTQSHSGLLNDPPRGFNRQFRDQIKAGNQLT